MGGAMREARCPWGDRAGPCCHFLSSLH